MATTTAIDGMSRRHKSVDLYADLALESGPIVGRPFSAPSTTSSTGSDIPLDEGESAIRPRRPEQEFTH
jgi:hypothetical protein